MNDNIISSLNRYVTDTDPQYAIALNGKWGTGKSYLIDKWIEQLKPNPDTHAQEDTESCESDIVIELEPILISVYGMKDIKEVCTAIEKKMHPFLYSKLAKIGKSTLKLLGKAIFKTDLNLTDDQSTQVSVSYSLDSLNLFTSCDDGVIQFKGGKILIIDDFERSNIDTKELLGFINGLVEKSNVHVVVVGDFEKLQEESKKVLEEFEEKTIGKKFVINPDIDDAVNSFLEEVPYNDWTRSQKGLILETAAAIGCVNLRIIRRAIHEFNSLLGGMEIPDLNSKFLKGFLATFIVSAVLCHDKSYGNLLRNFSTNYMNALSFDEEKKGLISSLEHKCDNISKQLGHNIINNRDISMAIAYLDGLANPTPFILDNIEKEKRDAPDIEKLGTPQTLSDDEFFAVYGRIESRIKHKAIDNPYELGRCLALLVNMNTFKIKPLDTDITNAALDKIQELIGNCNTTEQVYAAKNGFIGGYIYQIINPKERSQDKDKTEEADIVTIVNNIASAKSESVHNEMELQLLNLSDDNVAQLEDMDSKTAPNGQSAYELTAIFLNLEPRVILDRILHLSNKSLSVFVSFLRGHYKLDVNYISDNSSRYAADYPFFREFRKLAIVEFNKMNSGPRRYNFAELITTLFEILGDVDLRHSEQRESGVKSEAADVSAKFLGQG